MNNLDLQKSVLIITENKEEYKVIYETVEKYFQIEYTQSYITGFNMLNENIEKFSAVLIEDHLVIQGNFDLLTTLSLNMKFASLPVIIMLHSNYYEKILECIELGAVDVLTPPFNEKIIINRIKNAIKLKNSMSFNEIEKIMKELPSDISFKDKEGKYVFDTHYWRNIDGDEPEWSIKGKIDLDIRNDVHAAIKSMKGDMDIIHSGKGLELVIEINKNGIQKYLQLIKRPVFDKKGNVQGIIGLTHDVTEYENIKRKMQQTSASDDLDDNKNKNDI